MTIERFNFPEFFEGVAPGVTAAGTKQFFANPSKERVRPAPPRIITEDDLKAAERDGYKKGFVEGVEDGRKQAQSEQHATDLQVESLLEGFTAQVAPMFDDYRNMALELKEHMPKMALAVAKKVAAQALDEQSHELIYSMVSNACETMLHEPKITITVHESIADTLALKLKHLAERMPAATQLIIMRSPDMVVSDCTIEWQHGSLERSTQHICKQIEATIDNLIAASVRDSKQQLDLLYDTNPDPTDTTDTKE